MKKLTQEELNKAVIESETIIHADDARLFMDLFQIIRKNRKRAKKEARNAPRP